MIGAAPPERLSRISTLPAPSSIRFFGTIILVFRIIDVLNVRHSLRIIQRCKKRVTRSAIY